MPARGFKSAVEKIPNGRLWIEKSLFAADLSQDCIVMVELVELVGLVGLSSGFQIFDEAPALFMAILQ